MTEDRVLINENASLDFDEYPFFDVEKIESFHRTLPEYQETPLISLPSIASELSIGHVFVKDESFRLGLPSFKILGASWAVVNAVASRSGIQPDGASLAKLREAAVGHGVRLVTSTDGNWGRGCARMGKYLGVPVKVYVPRTMDEATQGRIASEGAEVVALPLDYDASVKVAEKEAIDTGSILVQDTAWPGYEKIPMRAVEGYSTLLVEADRQIREWIGRPVDIAFAPAGVGSFAQAVTTHYKRIRDYKARIAVVEPTAAACVQTSLKAGDIVPVVTGETIMDGMNCGTVSSIAWPVLKGGVDACVSVTDLEAHTELLSLHRLGCKAGPCGAAPLAALRRLHKSTPEWFDENSVVILFCTEGERPYTVPT